MNGLCPSCRHRCVAPCPFPAWTISANPSDPQLESAGMQGQPGLLRNPSLGSHQSLSLHTASQAARNQVPGAPIFPIQSTTKAIRLPARVEISAQSPWSRPLRLVSVGLHWNAVAERRIIAKRITTSEELSLQYGGRRRAIMDASRPVWGPSATAAQYQGYTSLLNGTCQSLVPSSEGNPARSDQNPQPALVRSDARLFLVIPPRFSI
jgi:hypothetical protein